MMVWNIPYNTVFVIQSWLRSNQRATNQVVIASLFIRFIFQLLGCFWFEWFWLEEMAFSISVISMIQIIWRFIIIWKNRSLIEIIFISSCVCIIKIITDYQISSYTFYTKKLNKGRLEIFLRKVYTLRPVFFAWKFC